MVSTNLLMRSQLLASSMLTRFRQASSFFCNKSVRDYDGPAPNDKKKKPDRLYFFLYMSGVRDEDVKLSFERNTAYVKNGRVEKYKGTGALKGCEGELYSPDTTLKIDMEAEMRMDLTELKLSVPKLKVEKKVFNVKVNVTD